MCIILISKNPEGRFPLIIASNRDEIPTRPSSRAHWWCPITRSKVSDETTPFLSREDFVVLGGRDLLQGGTWMGLSNQGHFCSITNFPSLEKANPITRGNLVADYFQYSLRCQQSSPQLTLEDISSNYLNEVVAKSHEYAGFTLIVGHFGTFNKASCIDATPPVFQYYSNALGDKGNIITLGENGIFGFGNSNIYDSEPEFKVKKGKVALEEFLRNPVNDHLELDDYVESLIQKVLLQEGVKRENEEMETVSSAVIVQERNGKTHFFERVHSKNSTSGNGEALSRHFQWDIHGTT